MQTLKCHFGHIEMNLNNNYFCMTIHCEISSRFRTRAKNVNILSPVAKILEWKIANLRSNTVYGERCNDAAMQFSLAFHMQTSINFNSFNTHWHVSLQTIHNFNISITTQKITLESLDSTNEYDST